MRMANRHMLKDVQHHYPLGKCKLKLWWNTTTHLNQTTDNIKFWWECGEMDVSCVSCIIRMQDYTAALGNSLAVYYKAKHSHTIWPSNLFLGIYTREIKTNVHIKPVHEYALHNDPKMDTIQIFSSGRMNKQTVEHPHNGILLSNKKQLNLDTLNILDELKGIMLSEEKSLFQRVT